MNIRTTSAFVCVLAATSLGSAQETRTRPAGVTKAVEDSIAHGIGFLVRSQNPDGSWGSNGRRGSYPTSMTALAGMALLGSGSTPTRGQHWLQVRRATSYLLGVARSDGLIASPSDSQPMYGHGFATMFLAQTYGMEEDQRRQKKIHAVLTRAVNLTGRSQSAAGGWIYQPDMSSDEGSVTVTQIQALRACRNAGVTVPSKIIDGAIRYIHNSANPDGGIRYRVSGGGASCPAISAAAVAVLYNAGRYDDPIAEKALVYSKKMLPVNGAGTGHHYYAQLYLAQALYQNGGEGWEPHYAKLANWLGRQQQRDGSWNGDHVGSVYGTAIALTILQLPHSYVPIYQR